MSDPIREGTVPRRKRKDRRSEPPELSMTPMIDVTFLLLVFFMVTSRFKTLEGKLSVFMPNDGINHGDPPEDRVLPVRVALRWNPSIARVRVYVGEVPCQYDEVGIDRAFRRVRQIQATGVSRAEIDAGGDVPVRWVVQALNMLMRADMPEITFTGAMDPLRDNR
ncbi:MAG: ExbD/TolR family protein [Planctomycetota bacterium]|jgi:biopolymer transport protein ExbD